MYFYLCLYQREIFDFFRNFRWVDHLICGIYKDSTVLPSILLPKTAFSSTEFHSPPTQEKIIMLVTSHFPFQIQIRTTCVHFFSTFNAFTVSDQPLSMSQSTLLIFSVMFFHDLEFLLQLSLNFNPEASAKQLELADDYPSILWFTKATSTHPAVVYLLLINVLISVSRSGHFPLVLYSLWVKERISCPQGTFASMNTWFPFFLTHCWQSKEEYGRHSRSFCVTCALFFFTASCAAFSRLPLRGHAPTGGG